jgi:hypothetical protein
MPFVGVLPFFLSFGSLSRSTLGDALGAAGDALSAGSTDADVVGAATAVLEGSGEVTDVDGSGAGVGGAA